MYRTIQTSVWYDPKVKKLSLIERNLFFYLITNNHAHMSGIYYISLLTISAETSIDAEEIKKALHRLATVSDFPDQHDLDEFVMAYESPINVDTKTGLVFFDFNFEIVWVKNMLKHQGRGSTVRKGVETHIATLHKCPLINTFREYYSSIQWGEINTPSMPHDMPYRYKEQKQEQKQKQKKIKVIKHEAIGIHFERFWNAYPRKKQKAQSQKVWVNENLDEKAEEIIADVIDRLQKDVQWQNHQFIPHPTTYLRNEGWKDEITINKQIGVNQNGTHQPVNKPNTRQAQIIEAEREYIESRSG